MTTITYSYDTKQEISRPVVIEQCNYDSIKQISFFKWLGAPGLLLGYTVAIFKVKPKQK